MTKFGFISNYLLLNFQTIDLGLFQILLVENSRVLNKLVQYFFIALS